MPKTISIEEKSLLHDPQGIISNRRYKDVLHRRSILLGIFIGITITICFLTLLPAVSINYHQYLYESVSDDMDTLINRSSGSSNENASSTQPTDIISDLYNQVKILCMVYTYKGNYKKKALWVNQTWGKRCNKLLFMANQPDMHHTIEVTVLNINESRDALWGKTKASFEYVYDNYLNEYDWFFKADDDTYAIMENLRYFLYPYPSDLPLYFGFEFQERYMSGGAGYVLSREAVKLFIEKSLHDPIHCSEKDSGAEDWEMGVCLQAINVTIGDSRDDLGRERFFPLEPDYMLNNEKDDTDWYYELSYYKNFNGLNCCSDTAISFHYVEGVHFYVLDYLLYQLEPFGFRFAEKQLPAKFSKKDVDIMFSHMNVGVNNFNLSRRYDPE